MLYGVWFLPQDGRMLSLGQRIFATCFLMIFISVGGGGIYWTLIYEQTPIAIPQLAKEIIADFDADKDGMVHVKRESAVIRCESSISCRTYERYKLFATADANKDTLVTVQELITIIRNFDTDKNGKINYRQEIARFAKEYRQYTSNGFRKEYIGFRKEPLVEK